MEKYYGFKPLGWKMAMDKCKIRNFVGIESFKYKSSINNLFEIKV
jgi:hypothetical protein